MKLAGAALVLLAVVGALLAYGYDVLAGEEAREEPQPLEPEEREAVDSSVAEATDPPPATSDGHEFTTITTDMAAALLEQADDLPGFVVFVDARSELDYGEGHVPGALRVDYQHSARDLPAALPAIESAYQVVVYCASRDCDDGLLLCRELRDYHGVPQDSLLLYEGGWREWEALEQPVEASSE